VLDIYWDLKISMANEESASTHLASSLCKQGERKLRSLYIRIVSGPFSPDFLVDSWSPPPHKLGIFRVETSRHYPCFSRLPRLIHSLSSELTYLQIALERLRFLKACLPCSISTCTQQNPRWNHSPSASVVS
jgi:hypothetical protein